MQPRKDSAKKTSRTAPPSAKPGGRVAKKAPEPPPNGEAEADRILLGRRVPHSRKEVCPHLRSGGGSRVGVGSGWEFWLGFGSIDVSISITISISEGG